MSFDIFNDIHIAWDNDRFIAMAGHLSFVEVTCILQWQGVKKCLRPNSSPPLFYMAYDALCPCVWLGTVFSLPLNEFTF
jgi:hypothetical protein